MGDPREPTDPRDPRGARDGLRERMGYPAAVGPAGAARGGRGLGRRGASASSSIRIREVIPTLGCKEAIFSFALSVVARRAGGARHGRRTPSPATRSTARRAVRRHARVAGAAAAGSDGFLPDLDAVDDETWAPDCARLAQLPEQPDRRDGAALASTSGLPALAREHGFVLASDEAYTELWFDEPPASALQLARPGRTSSSSTRSRSARSMTGYPERVSSPAMRSSIAAL